MKNSSAILNLKKYYKAEIKKLAAHKGKGKQALVNEYNQNFNAKIEKTAKELNMNPNDLKFQVVCL